MKFDLDTLLDIHARMLISKYCPVNYWKRPPHNRQERLVRLFEAVKGRYYDRHPPFSDEVAVDDVFIQKHMGKLLAEAHQKISEAIESDIIKHNPALGDRYRFGITHREF